MGKILEMTLQPMFRLFLALILSAALTGCGLPLVKGALSRVGGPTATPVTKPAKDSPQIAMTLVSRGIKFPMQQLDSQGNIVVWAAADGVQVALKDGVLISTRGFGMDLMSADVPTVAALSGDHNRTHHYLDGTDRPIRRAYVCSTVAAAGGDAVPNTTHLQESCVSDAGSITNDFWISGGNRIVKSRQWVSQGVGYAIFDTAGL